MDILGYMTSLLDWSLTIIWSMVLVFCLRRLASPKVQEGMFATLMAVLALDAFRTSFESLYFGILRTSRMGLLPAGLYDLLSHPGPVALPKALSLIAGVVVLVLLLRRLVPQEMEYFQDQQKRARQLEQSIRKAQSAESRLHESQERYRRVVRQTGQLIYDFTIADGKIDWGGAVEEITGRSADELAAVDITAWEALIHPEDRQTAVDLLARSLEEGAPYRAEYRLRLGTGDYRWIEDLGSFVMDELGKPIRMLGVMKDIDARKQADLELSRHRDHLELLVEERTLELHASNQRLESEIREREAAEETLRVSEERLRLALEGTTDGIWDWDLQTGQAYFSPRYCTMLGYEPGELPGSYDSWRRLLHPEDAEETQRTLWDYLARPPGSFVIKFRMKTKSDQWCWVLGRGKVVQWDSDGKPIRVAGSHSDITERQKVEEDLRATNEQLQAMVDSSPAAIYTYNPRSEVTLWSRTAEEMFGWSKKEAMGRPLPFIPPERMEEHRRFREKLLKGEVIEGLELARRKKDGAVIHINVSTAPLHDADGNVVGMMSVAIDITRRVRAEQALRESEEKFRAAFENAVIGRAIMTPEGPILQVNKALARTLGMSREELTEKKWQELVHPDYLSKAGELLLGLADQSPPSGYTEVKLLGKDGGALWVRVYSGLVRMSDDQPACLVVDIEDISHLKEYEERLRKYQQIVAGSQDLMALISRDYTYEAVNDRFLEALCPAGEDAVGRTVAEVMGAAAFEEKIKPRFDQALCGKAVSYRSQFEFAGLGRRFMEVFYFPFAGKSGETEGIVLNARDITETRLLEEQLIQSQKLESLGTLAGGVAHEINNPINGIMNYAQLIIDRIDAGSPATELAEEIIHETKRIAVIVKNLLTFARHEKQSHSPALISDIIASVLSLVQTVMRQDQVLLELDVPEDLPKIKCRSQQIQQVLMNLMTNARDALNEKYPGYDPEKRLRISSMLILKEDRKLIRTTVEDTGTGVPPEIRDRIFDPFFTTKPKERGTGLGLSISYGIVRDHGGELIVETEPGRGTCFHMDLPVNNGWKLAEH